jgi:hypothetical protein
MSDDKEKKDFELHSIKNLLGIKTNEFEFLSKLKVEEIALIKKSSSYCNARWSERNIPDHSKS